MVFAMSIVENIHVSTGPLSHAFKAYEKHTSRDNQRPMSYNDKPHIPDVQVESNLGPSGENILEAM